MSDVEVFTTAQDPGSKYVIGLHCRRVIEDVTASIGLAPDLSLPDFASATLRFSRFSRGILFSNERRLDNCK